MVDLEAKCSKMEFAETELRLGLPGDHEKSNLNYGKRGYDEIVDLKLNLSSTKIKLEHEDANLVNEKKDLQKEKPAPKAQVVGWPPVRSFRKNMITAVPKSSGGNTEEMEKGSGGAAFVKVSMDGAPYLRKVDLNVYKSYNELSLALTKLFSSFSTTAAAATSAGLTLKMMNDEENNLMEQVDHVPTYQDKDGDWMLVGDVPWVMFVESCKRLRIMKGTEAQGLAPRAMEKCKTRS